MTGMSTFIHSYQVSYSRDKVHIVDGYYYLVDGHGDMHVTSVLSLSSILHVPNFTLNLLFISHLTKNLNCCVIFFFFHCLF